MSTQARVGIDIEVLGYEQARAKMEELESQMKGLNGRKTKAKIQAEIDDLKLNKTLLKSQKVKLQADESDVKRKIDRIKQRINRLELSKIRFNMDDSAVKKVDNRIKSLKNEMRGLETVRIGIRGDIRRTQDEINQTTAAIDRLKLALSQMKGMSLGQVFNSTASKLAHMGQAMQSAGNALTRMASPVRNAMRLLGVGAGFAAFNKVSEGLQSGFSRYDTMKKYPKMMAEYNTASFTASQSIDKLDKAVRGLPTGLDEIVDLSQRFTLSLGDMEKGTNLAIAANNAFLASMTTESQRYQGMLQLQDLMNGKKLNSREWMSLGSSMGKAINEIGKELGYGKDEMGKFRQELYGGKIDTQKFLKALEKVGTGSGSIAKMAALSKETWEAFSANIRNAFSRMTAGVLESLDEISKAATGKNLNTLLADIVPKKIDATTKSIKDWIKANPKKITDFFDTLKSVNWASIGKGFAKGIGEFAKAIQLLGKVFGGGKNLEWIGKAAAYLMPLGSFLTITGGLIKGGRHIGGGIAALAVGFGRFVTAIGGIIGAGKLVGLGEGILNIIDKIKDFGKLKKATDTAEEVTKKAAKSGGKIKWNIKSLLKGLGGITAVAVTPAIISGGIMLAIKAVKQIVKDLGEVSQDMGRIDGDKMKKLATYLGTIEGVMAAVGGVIGGLMAGGFIAPEAVLAVVGGIAGIGALISGITGFASLASGNIKNTVKNIADAVSAVSDIADGINDLQGVHVNMSGLTRVMESVREAYQELKDVTGGEWFENSKMKKLKSKYENLGKVFSTILQSANDLQKIGNVGSLEGVRAKVDGIVDEMEALYTDMEERFDVKTKADVKGSKNAGKIAENIKGILKTVTGSIDMIKALSKEELDFEGAKQSISTIGTQMGELYSSLYGALADPLGTAEVALPGKSGKTKTVGTGGGINKGTVTRSGYMKSIVDNISNTINEIKGVYDLINEGAFKDVDSDAFSTQLENVEQVIVDVTAFWSRISTHLKKLTAGFGTDPTSAAGMFEGVAASLKSVQGIMQTLASIGQGIQDGAYGQSLGEATSGIGTGKLPAGGGGPTSLIDSAIANIQTIIDGIKQIATKVTEIPSIDELGAKMDQVRIAVDKIKSISTTLSTLGSEGGGLANAEGPAFTAINNIKLLVRKLGEALNTEVLAGLQAQVDAFRTAIQDMFTALNEDFANVEVTVNINGEVTGHDALIARVQSADAQIRAAVAGIKTSYTKHVSISIVGHVSRSGFGGLYPHTGGYVTPKGLLYRSKGGDVPFKPKGTDTIPAMLTPGEYVAKKAAVDFWGIDFMRKINHMDVRGVMRSISARAGHLASGARNTIINNTTTNNNQKVTQNIQTNNPNFAFRRSSRALGAL